MEGGREDCAFCVMSTSQVHKENAKKIDNLEDTGRLNNRISLSLHWVNNLEDIARDIVEHNSRKEIEEMDFAYGVARDYKKRMVRWAYKREEIRNIFEFGISRYNAILREAGISEKYILKEEEI